MKNTFYIILLFLLALVACNSDDDAPQTLVPPSDLTLEVAKSEDDPGTITLTISSNNTNFYKVYFGDDPDENPANTKSEELQHTYAESGTYMIKVQAFATDAVYITEEKEVIIDLEGEEEPLIPTTGYVSPEAYDGMSLVWQDEFEGTELNTEDWTFEIGRGENGWGNNELQYYREENTTVEDGYLIITAKEEAFESADYTSSRIVTKDKQAFQYGRIDIRAALPEGQGIWPALWMLGASFPATNWPASGEIDIMEMVGGSGRENTVHGTIHWDNDGENANYSGKITLDEGTFSDEFHVYSIVWDENNITWYVDDRAAHHEADITPEKLSEFHQEFFLIFNVAVGGEWPGSPDASTTFPQRMVVDYVRVFQEN